MSEHSGSADHLSHLKIYLEEKHYAAETVTRCIYTARRFLADLTERHIDVAAVRPAHVDQYLKQQLLRYRQRHGRLPSYKSWRSLQNDGIRMLLRVVQGQWPPIPDPVIGVAILHQEICKAYAEWIGSSCGRSAGTVSSRCAEASRFQDWVSRQAPQMTLASLTVLDMDNYMKYRAQSLRRSTLRRVAGDIRGFLRWLHMTDRATHDHSVTVVAPSMYAFENIPSAVPAEDVEKILAVTKKDRTPKGMRDYAILLLLSRYGMRAGEITALRLNDLDWRNERIRVHHSKTGTTTYLPLLSEVGEAMLRYLRKARPITAFREVFIRCYAPYGPFKAGANIGRLVQRRFEEAGTTTTGKHNPHAFRHARAVSMLRAGIPVKQIGDLLGHQSAKSTLVYLKLATEDLRAVAMEIPTEAIA